MGTKIGWKRTRKLFNDLHLWMGLSAGLILFVVCLTGTIYTFHTEIDHWLNAEKYKVTPAAAPLAVEDLVAGLHQEVDGEVVWVKILPTAKDTYQFYVRKEGERRGTTYLVNQYTGELLGDTKSSTSEFFMAVFRLHRWLLMDTSIGRPIVGWSTMIFAFIILTGLIIWVPQKVNSWRQGLKIKWSGNWKRINHDLHNALGFYAAIFLLVMALTGLQWSFSWYRTGLRSVLGVEQSRNAPASKVLERPVPESTDPMSVAAVIRQVEDELPYSGAYRIELPSAEERSLKVNKYRTGFFASPAADVVEIDVYSSQVLSVERFSDKPFNERVARSIKALHVGDVFGTFSKIIYFISCLIATSLPITGTIIWINKLKKKRAKRLTKAHAIAQMA